MPGGPVSLDAIGLGNVKESFHDYRYNQFLR